MNRTIRFLSLLGLLLMPFATMSLYAQNRPAGRGGQHDHRARSSLVLDINARVLEDNTVVWNETESKTTIPGRAVGIQLVGSNVVVAVQFTPFIRRSGNVLVAQGQIWIEDPELGISYYTSIQTIPVEFGESILFLPLGTNHSLDSSIEILITVNPIETNSDND